MPANDVNLGDLISSLEEKGEKGSQIANEMYQRHVHYEDAAKALIAAGYAVHMDQILSGEVILSVSDEPQTLDFSDPFSDLAVFFSLENPEPFGSVIWHSD